MNHNFITSPAIGEKCETLEAEDDKRRSRRERTLQQDNLRNTILTSVSCSWYYTLTEN